MVISARSVALFLLAAAPAQAQSNLDAGKSPAQIFAHTCNACHRSPREIKRTSVAFMREHERKCIVVLAPRLSARVGFPPIGERWQDTSVELPEPMAGVRATDLFTGRELRTSGRSVALADAFGALPFAVYQAAL